MSGLNNPINYYVDMIAQWNTYLCHSSSNVRKIENIELIWNIAFLFGRQTMAVSRGSLPATNTAYLVAFRDRRKVIAIRGKFATVCQGIWQTGQRNLEKICSGTLRSLRIGYPVTAALVMERGFWKWGVNGQCRTKVRGGRTPFPSLPFYPPFPFSPISSHFLPLSLSFPSPLP